MRRRAPKPEPTRCICEPGADAHHQHAKPGRKAPARWNPKCPHWDRHTLALETTRRPVGQKQPRKGRKLPRL